MLKLASGQSSSRAVRQADPSRGVDGNSQVDYVCNYITTIKIAGFEVSDLHYHVLQLSILPDSILFGAYPMDGAPAFLSLADFSVKHLGKVGYHPIDDRTALR